MSQITVWLKPGASFMGKPFVVLEGAHVVLPGLEEFSFYAVAHFHDGCIYDSQWDIIEETTGCCVCPRPGLTVDEAEQIARNKLRQIGIEKARRLMREKIAAHVKRSTT